jgi:ABC-type polysaccharide/polyol phosphate transport system ATPase subunit
MTSVSKKSSGRQNMMGQIADRQLPRSAADGPWGSAIEIADVSKWGGAVQQLEQRFARNEALQLLMELATLMRGVKHRKKGRLGELRLTPLLRNVSLTIERGSVVGIVDVGGASRTALLRILANCDLPSRGAVRLFGKMAALQHLAAVRLPYNTCRQNMEFDGRLMGWARDDVLGALDRLSGFSELASKCLDIPIRRLSVRVIGELGFSLLCCLDYDILVVDEIAYPRSREVAANWQDYLRRAPERGKTVIVSSRQLRKLYGPCTHLLLIKDAEVLDYGATEAITKRHEDFLALAERAPLADIVGLDSSVEDDEYGELA